MRRFPIEELVDRVGSCYSVVVAAAKRAKQIKDGAPPLVQVDSRNPLTIALHEIAVGLVEITEPVAPAAEPPAAAATEVESTLNTAKALPDLPLIDLPDTLGEAVVEAEVALEEEEEEEDEAEDEETYLDDDDLEDELDDDEPDDD